MEQYLLSVQEYPLLWLLGIPLITLFLLAGAQQAKWHVANSLLFIVLGIALVLMHYDDSPQKVVAVTPAGTDIEAILSVLMAIALILSGILALGYKYWKYEFKKEDKASK